MIQLTYQQCVDRYGYKLGGKVWRRQKSVREAAEKKGDDDERRN